MKADQLICLRSQLSGIAWLQTQLSGFSNYAPNHVVIHLWEPVTGQVICINYLIFIQFCEEVQLLSVSHSDPSDSQTPSITGDIMEPATDFE